MITCLAYHLSSQDQTARLFDWIRKLKPSRNHTLILGVERRVTLRFTDELSDIFEDVVQFDFTDHVEHYPESKNLAFQQCALFVQSLKLEDKRFLYLEPDAVPTRGTFLDEIEVEAKTSGKPFIGPLVPAAPTHATPEHMAAVAVYPVDLITAGAGDAMLALEHPWPAVIARAVLPNMAISTLICHDWEGRGVPKGCALYHPDRDGSILKNLSALAPAQTSRGDDKAREGERLPALEETSEDSRGRQNLSAITREPAPAADGEAKSPLRDTGVIEAGPTSQTGYIGDSSERNRDTSGGGQLKEGSEVAERTSEAVKHSTDSEASSEEPFRADDHAGSNPAPPNFFLDPAPVVFPEGMGKTHPDPWENRLQSEETIKFLARELKKFCTKPAYTNYVRKVLKVTRVVPGGSKIKGMERRKKRLGAYVVHPNEKIKEALRARVTSPK